MTTELVHIGWVVIDRQQGTPIRTGPLGRGIGKVYSTAGRARQVASNYGGKEWQERYHVTSVYAHLESKHD